jgi:dihydroorotate dehydrogenase
VQVFTAMVYRGPRVVAEIASGLADTLRLRRTEMGALVGPA